MVEECELPVSNFDWNITEKEVFIKNAEKFRGDFSFLVIASRMLSCPQTMRNFILGNEVADYLISLVGSENVHSLNQILDFIGGIDKDHLDNCYILESYMDGLDIYKGHSKLVPLPDGVLRDNLWKSCYSLILEEGHFREVEDEDTKQYFKMLLCKKFIGANPIFVGYKNGEYTFEINGKEYVFTVSLKE